MTSGTASMPASAAKAPRAPKQRSPNISAMLTTFGPGRTWPSASISTNSAFVIQRLFSTSSRCATASTPPKPCKARALKVRKSSVFDCGRSRGASSAPVMPSSPMHLERVGIDDVGRVAADEVDDVGEGRLEVELVAVLLDVADVRRADRVLETQQQRALQDRLALAHVDCRHPGAARDERRDQRAFF